MERKKASDYPQELWISFTSTSTATSAAAISWIARRNSPSAA